VKPAWPWLAFLLVVLPLAGCAQDPVQEPETIQPTDAAPSPRPPRNVDPRPPYDYYGCGRKSDLVQLVNTNIPPWPVVSGDWVAYEDVELGRRDRDLYLFNWTSGEKRLVGSGPADQFNAVIEYPWVAWRGQIYRHPEKGYQAIEVHHIPTNTTRVAYEAPIGEAIPYALSEGRVLFNHGRRDPGWELTVLDIESGEVTHLNEFVFRPLRQMHMWKDRVVWAGGNTSWSYIALLNLTTGERQVLAEGVRVESPYVRGDRVAWVGMGQQRFGLYLWENGSIRQIETGPVYDPHITEDMLLWLNSLPGSTYIYRFKDERIIRAGDPGFRASYDDYIGVGETRSQATFYAVVIACLDYPAHWLDLDWRKNGGLDHNWTPGHRYTVPRNATRES
jgi:hypothetical protein